MYPNIENPYPRKTQFIMLTLADSTDLVQQTTEQLSTGGHSLTPQAGITLIDEWLEPLMTAENTRPIADKLGQLKTLLEAPAINNDAVQTRMGELAELTSTLGTGMGAEGEMPSLLEGLSSALRQAAQTSKADS